MARRNTESRVSGRVIKKGSDRCVWPKAEQRCHDGEDDPQARGTSEARRKHERCGHGQRKRQQSDVREGFSGSSITEIRHRAAGIGPEAEGGWKRKREQLALRD